MDAFLPPLLEALPGRVAFVGIQGSFGRGEAGPESDVDLVVVLDALGAAELAVCRGVLEKMPFADRACGFFCDRAALAAWPAFDALQLRLDTSRSTALWRNCCPHGEGDAGRGRSGGGLRPLPCRLPHRPL